jgi:hypothetical protein
VRVSFQRAAQSKHTPIVTAAWHPSLDSPKKAPSQGRSLMLPLRDTSERVGGRDRSGVKTLVRLSEKRPPRLPTLLQLSPIFKELK